MHPARPRPTSRYRRSSMVRPLLAAAGAVLGLMGLTLVAPDSATATPQALPAATDRGAVRSAHHGALAETTPGLEIGGLARPIDWAGAYAAGARFVYLKATEGTSYQDPDFPTDSADAAKAGFLRGAYHFATPSTSTGTAQADYFVAHGGSWSADGKTLPPLLDIENGASSACWGLGQAAMRTWLTDFVGEVHARTGRWPVVYTTTSWWTQCTGDFAGLGTNDPLFIARNATDPGTLPAGWATWTFWQHPETGRFPGDGVDFNGSLSALQRLANNG